MGNRDLFFRVVTRAVGGGCHALAPLRRPTGEGRRAALFHLWSRLQSLLRRVTHVCHMAVNRATRRTYSNTSSSTVV